MSDDDMFSRIRSRLRELGLTERGASMQAVNNPDLIRYLKRDRSRSPRGASLVKLAKVLGVTESWLLGTSEDMSSGDTEPSPGVRFGGIVEAGTFRPDEGLNQDNAWRYVHMVPDPRYPVHEQFAYEVMGDSMEKAGIVHGMYVLAVSSYAWERLHGSPGDGRLVIVSRTRDHTPERELTVKRLRIFMDRFELQPESSNPAHKPFVSKFPLQEEDQEWRIEAVVISASWLFI